MTDTIVKPMEWEGDYSRTAQTPFGRYTIGDGEEENWHTYTFHTYPYGLPSDVEFEGIEAAKAACQTDYEARILEALDLEGYRAQIRAEALEEAAALLRSIADKSLRSGKVPEAIVNNYRRSANILKKRSASIRTLTEKGEEYKTTWEQRHGWDEHG